VNLNLSILEPFLTDFGFTKYIIADIRTGVNISKTNLELDFGARSIGLSTGLTASTLKT